DHPPHGKPADEEPTRGPTDRLSAQSTPPIAASGSVSDLTASALAPALATITPTKTPKASKASTAGAGPVTSTADQPSGVARGAVRVAGINPAALGAVGEAPAKAVDQPQQGAAAAEPAGGSPSAQAAPPPANETPLVPLQGETHGANWSIIAALAMLAVSGLGLRQVALRREMEACRLFATRDALTGLANRRLFEETLEREVAR